MYLLIVFVLNMDSLDFLILIMNLCILWINLDRQIFIKSNGVCSSLFWINVGIYRPSQRMWWLLLTLKYKDNNRYETKIIESYLYDLFTLERRHQKANINN
jgi:hypothetical protein